MARDWFVVSGKAMRKDYTGVMRLARARLARNRSAIEYRNREKSVTFQNGASGSIRVIRAQKQCEAANAVSRV
jgi:hypothetical protein